jgi:hypothetical protein
MAKNMKVTKVDVWAAGLTDRPGALAKKLTALAEGGVNLEFVISRRLDRNKDRGVVFVTPIAGARRVRAARKAGFRKTPTLHSVRIQGPNRRGLGGRLTRRLGAAGINLRGVSAAAIGAQCVAYFAFDTRADANKAMRLLKSM